MTDYTELVKALRVCESVPHEAAKCPDDCPMYGTWSVDGDTCDLRIMAQAAKAIEKLTEDLRYWTEHYWDLWRDRWISAEARMPEAGDMVVTASRKGDAWFYRVEEYSGDDGFHYSNMFSREVKFWVPLPEVDAVERRTVVLQGGNSE